MNMRKFLIVLIYTVIAIHSQRTLQDLKCQSIQCPDDFRCQDGKCLRQQKRTKKTLCVKPEFLNKIQAIRCTNRDYCCLNAPNFPSCGFTYGKTTKDFENTCIPCLDKTVDYYYKMKCVDVPIICNQNQECVNGKCITMFDKTNRDKNRKICDSNDDCRRVVEMCVANKCVSKASLLQELAKIKSNSS